MVFAQWVDPANLAVLGSELPRTVVMLLAYTGFRVSNMVTLERDARVLGSGGHPYLATGTSKPSARPSRRSRRR